MTKQRMLVEYGMGSSLRRMDYTQAAKRAIENALWRNSINIAELFDFPKEAMIIDIEIGVQNPDAVNIEQLKTLHPYGKSSITVKHGGLDIPKPDGEGATIMANCALVVSFEMERVL